MLFTTGMAQHGPVSEQTMQAMRCRDVVTVDTRIKLLLLLSEQGGFRVAGFRRLH
jgi:hypothetical protein